MDADRFDALLRSLTQSPSASRRGMGRFVIGLTLGGFGLAQPAMAARSGKCKPACGECEACDKGKCERKNGKKRCKKGKCKAKVNGTGCAGGSCQNGSCIPTPPFCTGKNSCDETDVRCESGGAACFCFVTVSGEPFCGRVESSGSCTATSCPSGQACIVKGGRCGGVPGSTQCASPCATPL